MLHELQTRFLRSIYDTNDADTALPFIKEVDNRTLAEQLAVYRGSIFGGLKKALAETYPVTRQLVGDDFFERMLGDYISTYPCRVQDLNDYGVELPGFIAGLPQARSVPYLPDVAQLERLYNIALNAKPQPNNLKNLSTLTTAQQIQLKFHLTEGSGFLTSKYPVDIIWDVHSNSKDVEVSLDGDSVFLIILKTTQGNCINRLSPQQFYFLQCMQEKNSFVDVCELSLSAWPDSDINVLLAEAIQHGWVRSFSL